MRIISFYKAFATIFLTVFLAWMIFFHIEKKRAMYDLSYLRGKYGMTRYYEKQTWFFIHTMIKNPEMTFSWHNAQAIVMHSIENQNLLLALRWMKKYPEWFGLISHINTIHFHITHGKSYVMYTQGVKSKNHKYRINVNEDLIYQGNLFLNGFYIDLTHKDNLISTINHELRHAWQYERNIHFRASGDLPQDFFWPEQRRETDSKINKKNIVNARMEADAYFFQIMLCGLDKTYRRLLVHRLKTWYTPVLHPDAQLRQDIEKALRYEQFFCQDEWFFSF